MKTCRWSNAADEPDVLREQHAVAEDVTAHVADADDREVLGLGVEVDLAEVPLDRLPRAPGGDAHRLVVVAGRATRGERVVEPEAVGLGHTVRDVGERRRALVGRDDEVDVVAVVPHDPLGRHGRAGHPVVGDVEQPGDEHPVCRLALLQPRLAVDRGVGQLLRVEAALGPRRHDDGVLDHLGLDEAEDLGAEVLAPVGPAQAAAGHRAEAEVHALDPRAVDPDLELRPGCREVGHRLGVELEGDVGLVLRTVGAGLVEVRAQAGPDDAEEGTDDPVVVEGGHLVERVDDALGHDGLGCRPLTVGCSVSRVTGIRHRGRSGPATA